MLVNDHCHSICSMDGTTSMTDMALAARAAGVSEVTFTDHCDCVDENGRHRIDFSWQAELEEFARARAALDGTLQLHLGIELGEPTQDPAAAARILAEHTPDLVIGSVHNPVEGTDYYFQHFTSKADCEKQLRDYVRQLRDIAESDFYDVLGHITYPLRYMRVRDGIDVSMDFLQEELDEVYRTVISRGKGIELNTSGYLNCGGVPMPPKEQLLRYRALGGRIITVGSDAHVPERMAQGLADGMELLKACGFRYFTVYEGRKPQMLPL